MSDINLAEAADRLTVPTREQLLHSLYEAAELEHNLMCTYLYAAFSLKDGEAEGLTPDEAKAVAAWREAIIGVAIDEMGHLAAVWNITSALGGAPRVGRGNFPIEPGLLPAGIIVKLAPFGEAALQHFIYLERPLGSREPEGEGYERLHYSRLVTHPRLTPMGSDYETVGDFYARLEANLRAFVDRHGEREAFCGDPALQLSPAEVDLTGARPVMCLKTALEALDAIVTQGEGAPSDLSDSHFQRFIRIRDEFEALNRANPDFAPSFPSAVNPVLRPPPKSEGRVWIEDEDAAEAVDLANSAYSLMLRLIGYAYAVPRPSPEKAVAVDLAIALMAATTRVAQRAARLPAGPSNSGCNAGMTFTALRDAAALPPGPAARRFFVERLAELSDAASEQAAGGDPRAGAAARMLADLAARAERAFAALADTPSPPPAAAPDRAAGAPADGAPPVPTQIGPGIEAIEGRDMTLIYEGKRCIHSRFCVTWAPKVFIANIEGPWIHPDAMDVDALVEVAHVCVSGAIRYQRKDGKPEEAAPPVNLISVREGGPYAIRADIRLDGEPAGYRATLCRCGASKNKPFCDGSHHEIEFSASGEPPTGKADMLAVRDGPLAIDPQTDGPLQVRGNLEIISGTGRVVARVQTARLCRCGHSGAKPFCDNTHLKIGFKST